VREYYSGANSMGPYLCAKFIYDLPYSYATVLLSTTLYWMSGERTTAGNVPWTTAAVGFSHGDRGRGVCGGLRQRSSCPRGWRVLCCGEGWTALFFSSGGLCCLRRAHCVNLKRVRVLCLVRHGPFGLEVLRLHGRADPDQHERRGGGQPRVVHLHQPLHLHVAA
jgi:hypothetical protein